MNETIHTTNTNEQDIEGVGSHFEPEKLIQAQRLAWEAYAQMEDRIRMMASVPGRAVSVRHVLEVCNHTLEQFGFAKQWHTTKFRTAEQTTYGFSRPHSYESVLQKNDICFIDLGPVYKGYEADVGTSFVLGQNEEYERCVRDVKEIWQLTSEYWKDQKISGIKLYEYAQGIAKNKGWDLETEMAGGHRLGEFPHHAYYKGPLNTVSRVPVPGLWMLEIHILDPNRRFGAFHEDLMQ